jgi:hypothetical protein
MSRAVSALLALTVVVTTPALAATRRVPSEYSTINAALDLSVAGDSVLVAPGSYATFEVRGFPFGTISSVAFLKGGVTLRSEGGPEVTILRMDGTPPGGPVVSFGYLASGTTLVEGFTFAGTAAGMSGLQFSSGERCIVRDCLFLGLGGGVPGSGLGVASVRADLELYGCRFEGIHGVIAGGVYQESSTLLMEDCEFRNVRSGAVELSLDSGNPHPASLTMRRCRFYDNEKTTGTGGAIAVGYPQVLIEDCWFENNRSVGGPNGAGAIAFGGLTTVSQAIRNCTFLNNWITTGKSGAIWGFGGSAEVTGNTFCGNHQVIDWGTGGSSVYLTGGSFEFRNNVIVNSAGDQAVGISNGTITTGCNVYWNNPLGNTSGFPLDPTDFNADPMFCDPEAGDLRVNAISICLPENNPSCDEPIGAWGEGCGSISVQPESWGRVKNLYRAEPEGK